MICNNKGNTFKRHMSVECVLHFIAVAGLKFCVDIWWIHYSWVQTCIRGLLLFSHYHVLCEGALLWCLSGALQRSRCMSGTILPEHWLRMLDRKLHYFFFSESVRKKKQWATVNLGLQGLLWLSEYIWMQNGLEGQKPKQRLNNCTAGAGHPSLLLGHSRFK